LPSEENVFAKIATLSGSISTQKGLLGKNMLTNKQLAKTANRKKSSAKFSYEHLALTAKLD
jgi:hypothetical protein